MCFPAGKKAFTSNLSPAAHLDIDVLRGNENIADNHVRRAVFDLLDLVFESNVGESHFHNMRCKTSPRAECQEYYQHNVLMGINLQRGGISTYQDCRPKPYVPNSSVIIENHEPFSLLQ